LFGVALATSPFTQTAQNNGQSPSSTVGFLPLTQPLSRDIPEKAHLDATESREVMHAQAAPAPTCAEKLSRKVSPLGIPESDARLPRKVPKNLTFADGPNNYQ